MGEALIIQLKLNKVIRYGDLDKGPLSVNELRRTYTTMWKINDSYQWDSLKRKFGWIRDMQGVPQDPAYHAEGDVEIHTRMVLEALQAMEEFKALEEQLQHILVAAALLHDVEKRSTTVRESDGRITSRGHAKKGELTSRSLLYLEVPTPFPIREQVVKLVRYHGLPLWVFDKPDPRKAVIEASLEVDTHLLAILAKADVLGRICADQEELLYKVELFRELCLDYECYGKPRTFQDDFTKFFYLHREEVSPDYAAYNDTKFEVVLLSGLPGSGKDMYINFNLSDWPVVSLDDLRKAMKIKPKDKSGNGRVIQAAKERAKTYMRRAESFVWNATNITRQMREQLINLFTSYGGFVKIVYLEVPYPMLVEQNRNREDVVPPDAMVKMLAKLEVPSPAEAHTVEYVIREQPEEDQGEMMPEQTDLED